MDIAVVNLNSVHLFFCCSVHSTGTSVALVLVVLLWCSLYRTLIVMTTCMLTLIPSHSSLASGEEEPNVFS
jgi:hypothetical protein